jgi:hypothetical protein
MNFIWIGRSCAVFNTAMMEANMNSEWKLVDTSPVKAVRLNDDAPDYTAENEKFRVWLSKHMNDYDMSNYDMNALVDIVMQNSNIER